MPLHQLLVKLLMIRMPTRRMTRRMIRRKMVKMKMVMIRLTKTRPKMFHHQQLPEVTSRSINSSKPQRRKEKPLPNKCPV